MQQKKRGTCGLTQPGFRRVAYERYQAWDCPPPQLFGAMTVLFVFTAHAHLKTTPAKVRSRDGLSQSPAYVLKY
jgi:hypothetical protein